MKNYGSGKVKKAICLLILKNELLLNNHLNSNQSNHYKSVQM